MRETNIDSGMDAGLLQAVVEIKHILKQARNNVAAQVNNELLTSYWKIGEIIVRYEQELRWRQFWINGIRKNKINLSSRMKI